MKKPRVIILASGSKTGGGSGLKKLIEATKKYLTGSSRPILDVEIVAIISSWPEGGPAQYAKETGITFEHLPKDHYNAHNYRALVKKYQADFVICSGWLKPVSGISVETVFNIHPGPLPECGGKGMYGHFVHEWVIDLTKEGVKFTHSNVGSTQINMHFVDDFTVARAYDTGLVFFRKEIPFMGKGMIDADTLYNTYVRPAEHFFQSFVTDLVTSGHIALKEEKIWYSAFAGFAISRLLQEYTGLADPSDATVAWYISERQKYEAPVLA